MAEPTVGASDKPTRAVICVLCQHSHPAQTPCSGVGLAAPMRGTTQLMAGDFPWNSGAPERDLLVGTAVGSFRIVRKLGEGGMGSVYLAEQALIGSKVAVKFLHEHLSSSNALVKRFYAEARAVNLIGHENIVNIFDMNVLPPRRYYLVMEYLDGQSLATFAEGPLDPALAVPILAQVCDALQAAHEHGVIHRDLKPENLFLLKRKGPIPFVKVLDFGIAKLFAAELDAEQTAAGAIVGTPEYMAPEQATGEVIDGRADIYALGVIAYRMLTGRLPFEGNGIPAMLIAHRDEVVPPPRKFNEAISPALSAVLLRALAKRREDRPATAAAFKEGLELALAAEGDTASPSRRHPVERTAPPLKGFGEPENEGAPAVPSEPSSAVVDAVGELKTPALRAGSIFVEGGLAQAAIFADLSRGGLYVVEAGLLPKIFSRIRLCLDYPPTQALCEADVVRVVPAEQAKAWCMSPGYAVQFVKPPALFREALAALLEGREVPRALSERPAWMPPLEDPDAERILGLYEKRVKQDDPYGVLMLGPDAEFPEISLRGREARKELEALAERQLASSQAERLERVLEAVVQRLDQIATPPKRAEYDAETGNFRGIARCLSAGLTVTALEAVREAFLERHPKTEANAYIALASGKAWESKGETGEAIKEYERALSLDPLNLSFHQRYWTLKRKT